MLKHRKFLNGGAEQASELLLTLSTISEGIEDELFALYDEDTAAGYKRMLRTLISNLTQNEQLVDAIVDGSILPAKVRNERPYFHQLTFSHGPRGPQRPATHTSFH